MKKTFFLLLTAATVTFTACEKSDSAGFNSEGGGRTGTGGSMAKFTITGNYMYTVQGNLLHSYDISDPGKPVKLNTTDLKNNGVETIFSNGTYLFFGTQNGMLIYGLGDPARPDYLSTYQHVVSCDPVVVSGNLAWVTLSTGNTCMRGSNQLEVIDISNIYTPRLIKVYPFTNPKGLAVSGNHLYLCDEVDGMQLLDITDPLDASVINRISGVKAFDVIVRGNVLTLTAKDGVYQYDCSDPLNLRFLSKIAAG